MNRLSFVAKKFAFPLIVLFVLTATACQLGLGAAVDSQAPVVEIALPGANSIIRDKFVMSGTWSDDREIAGIKVELENTSTKEVLVSVDVPEAQLADNKWYLEINPFEGGQNLPDGKYNATVTVKDKVDHATSAAVAFIIDNTAPLVILSRPATKVGATSPEKYGWDFSLQGEAVDDNLISLVEVEVYDSNDELKTTVKLENVSKKIDRSVAVFGADDKAYEKIYGEIGKLEEAQQKNFYCKVFAYDEARKVPAVDGDKGNRTEIFYLESEVSKYISEYKSSGFYEILKGTYSSPERSAGSKYSVDEVKGVIENNKIQQASFSLDPRNNPKYTVSSRSNLSELSNDLTSDSAKLTNKNVVTINLIRGLDGYYIDLDSVGVSLIECDDKGKAIEGKDKIVLLEPFKEGDDRTARDALFSVSDGIYSLDVTISTILTSELKIGKFYKFDISGKDENGISIFNYAGTDYAFKLVSANATPNLTISKLARLTDGNPEIESTSTTSTVLGNGEKLVIYGESSLEDLVPELKVLYGLSNNLSENVLATKVKGDDGDTGYGTKYEEEGVEKTVKAFKFVIELPETEKNKDVKIRVIATNPEEAEQQASKELDVSYDCTAPVFGAMTITPTVTENEVDYVNGTITIKGSVEDAMNTISEVYYYDGEEIAANKKTIEKIAATGFRIDTTKFTDNAQTIVKVYAVDKAGNIGEKEIPLNVKQSTDAPVISFTTVDPEINSLEKIRSASAQNKTANIFQINGANNYIGGSITDDDGIKTVTIYKRAKGSTEWKSEVLLENGTTTAYNLKNVAAKVQGEYDVYIVVEDTAGEATGFNTTSMEAEPFHIGVDEGAPNFMITSTQGLQAQNQNLVVNGTVSDGAAVEICRFVYETATEFVSGKRYFIKNSETNTYTEQDSSEWTSLPAGDYYCRKQDTYFTDLIQIPVGTTSWTDTIPAAEVGTTGDILYYEATDIFGQTTGQSYYYTIDNQSPKFTITKVNSTLALSGQVAAGSRENIFVKVTASDPYLTIEGTAEDIEENDPTKSRGLDEFAYYTIIAADSALSEVSLTNDAFDVSSWKTTKKIENHTWKQTVDLTELNLADGKKYILYVAVKDAAGNISKVTENPCSAVYIIQDSTKPEFTEPGYKLGNNTIGADDAIQINTSNNDKNIVLSVKIQDVSTGTPSGIEKVELLENNVAYAFTKDITSSGDNYTVTIKASELATGTHSLVLRATDKVGNYNDFAWKEIGVDVTDPSNPLITGVTPFVTDESDNTVYNGKITIKVSASDETALDKVTWWVTKDDGTTIVIDATDIDCAGVTSKNASIVIDTDDKLTKTNGTFKFFVKSQDKGGNESGTVSETLKIDQATDQPKITLSNAEVGITTQDGMKAAILAGTTANIFGSSTNNKLNFTVTDDDGIASVIVTDSSKVNPVKVYEYEPGTYQKTLKLSYTLPSVKELYDIKIDVADYKGETTSYKTNTTGTFKVAVDDAEPQITNFTTTIDSKLKDGVLYTKDNFKINFDVSDDYKLGSLVYSENKGTAIPVSLTDGASSETIEISIPKQGTAGADAATKVTNVITLKDAFGRYKEKELTYVFDLKAPVFSNVSHTSLSSGYMDAAKTFTVTGKVTDAGTNQSGVNEIKFAVAKGHVNSFPATETTENTFKSWTEVSGSAANWTAKIDAEEITVEGPYTLFVKATDLAGNETVYGSPIQFIADNTAPTSTISTPATYYNKADAGTNVVIEGTITETYLNYSSFAVEVKKNGTKVTTGFTPVAPTAANGNKWSVSIPVVSDGTSDGSYEVKASFKDFIHKEVSTSVAKTMIDTKAPVFSDVAYTLLNTKYMDATKTFSVTGKADETGNGKSGVNEIKFAVAKGHVASFPATETTENTFKSWTDVSGSAAGWTAKLDANEITVEGNYTLFVKATDLAGNETVYGSPIQFIADKAAPTSTISTPATYYNKTKAGTNVVIEGTITETYLKDFAVEVTKDENVITEGFTTSAPTAANGNKWSVLIPVKADASNDGTYAVKATFTDNVNKSGSTTVATTTIDTTPLTFANVAPNLINTSYMDATRTYSVTGVVNNTGSGASPVDTIKFAVAKGHVDSFPTVAANVFKSWTDVSGSAAGWTARLEANEITAEGKYTLFVKATDLAGNETVYGSPIQFIADKAIPEAGVSSIKRASTSIEELEDQVYANLKDTEYIDNEVTKHKFTLSGSASDSNKLGKVVVTAEKGETKKTLVTKTAKATGETDALWAWACDILLDSSDSAKSNYLENGIWTFTVNVTDACNKNSEPQTFRVVIDTVNPVMVPVYGSPSSADWRNVSSLTVKPAATDTNGSGLESVSYVIVSETKTVSQLEGNGNNAVSDGAWVPITGANKNVATEKTIGFDNGANYLYIKAVDNAGNISFTSAYQAQVDMERPEIVMNTPGAVALVNGNVDIDVSKFGIVVSDQTSLSGVSKVDIYIDSIDVAGTNIVASSSGSGGLTIDSDGNVTGSIAKAKFSSKTSSFKLIAQVTDTAGNKSNVNTSIGVDVKKPDVTIKTSAKNGVANKNLTIEGTTYDLNGVSSIKLEYLVDSTWIDITDSENGLGLSNLGDTSSWSFVIPTYDSENNSTIAKLIKDAESTVQEIKFRATAVDVAENSKTTDEVTVTIDQDSDRPVVSFVNLSENNQILQSATINGNVTDDDNWGTGCVFKIDTVNHTAAEWKTLSQPGQLNIDANGTFSYTPVNAADGEKQMFFYIKDAAGTEFITASGNKNDRPKLKYKGASENSDNNAVVVYTADTASPAIKEIKFGTDPMTQAKVAGGNDSSITIGMVVLDTNGVASAKAVIGSTEYALTKSETVINTAETFPNLANTNKDEITIGAGSKKAVFTSDSIDVSTWASGQTTVTFEVTDNSGLKSQTTGYFTVDNLGPQVTVRVPSDFTEEKTGNVDWSFDFTDYPNTYNAGFSKYSYLVLNDDYFTGNAVDESKILTYMRSNLSEIAGGASSVNGLTLSGLPTVAQAEATSKFKKITTIRTDVYSLPVYFYAVDKNGNETLQSFTMIYNLFGGRPSTNVAYPAGTEEEPQAMNGTIRLSGGASGGVASGAAGVEKVYVQFDVTKGTDFSTTDRDYLAGYTISGSENKIYTIHEAANVSVTSNAEINWAGLGGSTDFWGIPVTGSTNWYKVINENLEFQNDYNEIKTGVYRVAVRSVALASDGVFGSWSPVQFFDIDTNIPVVNQEPARIVIDGSGTIDYVQDMYVKGDAKLQVAVADKADVTKVMVYTAASQSGLNDASQAVISTLDLTDENVATRQESTWTGLKGYTVNIALPAPSENKKDIYVKVVAYKANEASAYANYHINFDNTAPSIKKLQFNSVDWLSTDEATHRLVNSNGKFTLGGTATDQESGYDKVGFYFIRGDVSDVSKYSARIYDPMANNKEILVKAKGATSLSLVEKPFGVADEDLGSSEQKMYGVEYVNASIAEADVTVGGVTEKRSQITLGSEDVNTNIKKAGYVLVDGNFYQIDTVDSSTKKITLTENVSSIVGTYDVFFPFMQFVENTGSEKTDEDGLGFTAYPNSDDGDGMPESIIKSQSTWAWDASIQSTYIPDGPGTMVVFVWDKAGNVSAASYACSVQNHAPRLAKLYLATDLDGSGTYDDEEFKVYDVLGKTGIEQSSYVMNTEDYLRSQFKIKNGLALVTEFTGGNLVTSDDYPSPTIRAMYNKASPDNETKCIKSTAVGQTDLVSPDSSILDAGDLKSAVTAANSNMYAYSFAADKVGDDSYNSATGTFDSKPMSWTFWDVTSDTTQGVNSSYMYLKVGDFIVDQNDTTPPEMRIKPFYWNSKEDSSVPTDSSENPLGHIDFAATQTDQTKPGVSGRVYIEGTAHDNTRHGALFMVDPDGTEGQVAEFKDGKWIVGNNTTGILTYEYMDGTTATPTAAWTWPSNWKQFEILEAGKPNQEGHDVTWRFTIDMTPYGIGTDKVVTCYGKDAKENTADYNTDARDNTSAVDPKPLLNQTNDTVQTAKYIMDFVPYIKGIKGANRSRLGRYPVRAGATIQIEGMNFATTSTYTVNFKKSNGDVASTIANANVTTVSDGVIEVTAPNYSAFLEVVVDGVATQNNTNQNTKWNIEEGNWKKGDLKAGANYWSDDRYLSVWNVDTTFDGSINAHRGTIKKIQQKDTGSGTGKHVSNAPVADTLGGGAIYKQPGGNTQVDTLTDQTGHYYAAYSSDDLKVYGHVSTKTYSGHGDNVMYNSSEAAFQTPADEFDYTIVAGMPYYVVQDSWISGESANVWGTGLYISKEGAWWDRSYNAKFGTDIGEDEEFYIIERQGASGSKAAARDSSSGYDEVLKQFKNPKIAGWYNPDESLKYTTKDSGQYVKGVDYLYVSYYDSYAKCLKYASYKIGHRFDENGHAANFNWQHWGSHTEKSDIVPLMHTAPNKAYAATGVAKSDNMKTGNAVVAGWDTLQTNPTSFKEKAGEWSDIMVDPSDHYPVIIYYNETNRCLEVAHGKSYAPVSGNICNKSGTASADKTESEWTKTKNITPDANIDFGRYVSAEIDANGNIHAAAQDVSNGKLYYIFLKKSGSTYSASYILVDGTSSVGMWTDIQLNNDVSANKNWYEYEPVISYLDKSFLNTQQAAKVAYVIQNGADSCFDAMTDPAKYSANDQKTSVMSSVYEKGTTRTAKVAIGYNSDMLALDFLRDEQ